MSASNRERRFSENTSLGFLTSTRSGERARTTPSELQQGATLDAGNTESQLRQATATFGEGVHHADHPSYVRNGSVTDAPYDHRVRKVREFEESCPSIHSSDSSTQKIASRPAEALRIFGRPGQALSRQSIYEEAQFIRFDEACRRGLSRNRVNYVAEPLCDGVDVELIYKDGRLVQAYALGEARIGEDITAHVKTIKEVPLTLRSQNEWSVPTRLVVHGKLYMTRLDFRALNQRVGRLSSGQKFFANPRDAVIGSLRQADSKMTGGSPLRIFIHDVIGAQKSEFDTHWELLQGLVAWGFKINLERVQLCSGAAGAIDYYNRIAGERGTLPYETSGVLFSIDRLSDGAALALHEGVPPWAMEYRFSPAHHAAGAKSHERFKRFQSQEIIYHWVQGLPFLFLLMSGSGILFSKFNHLDPTLINAFRLFHKITATTWVIGLIATFFFIGFKLHLANLRQMLTWTMDDLRWMYLSALCVFDSKIKVPDAGKFNPGQKMNMLLVIGYFFGFGASGVLMWFRGTILIPWYFHVALFFQALGSLGGHLYLSFIHPSTRIGLGGIFHGWVPGKYVEHHHALTLKLDQVTESPNKSETIKEH